MPPKKSCQQLEQAQMKALETIAQKHAALNSDTAAGINCKRHSLTMRI